MLRTAKANALCPELDSHFCLRGSIRICADAELAILVRPLHYCVEKLVCIALGWLHFSGQNADYFAWGSLDFAEEYFAGSAVNGNIVAFFDDCFADAHNPLGVVHRYVACCADAYFAHLARHESRVRAYAAAGCQNAFRGNHSAQIFGGSFLAAKDDFFALGI